MCCQDGTPYNLQPFVGARNDRPRWCQDQRYRRVKVGSSALKSRKITAGAQLLRVLPVILNGAEKNYFGPWIGQTCIFPIVLYNNLRPVMTCIFLNPAKATSERWLFRNIWRPKACLLPVWKNVFQASPTCVVNNWLLIVLFCKILWTCGHAGQIFIFQQGYRTSY